jgi:mannose-1-phosphate guanylyltransferase
MSRSIYGVVMAGGSGTRFWPASRAHLPKQFLRITGRQTMLEETLERISSVVPADQSWVVVGRQHEAVTRQLLEGKPAHVLVEPFGRNTAACIGLAAIELRRRDPEALLIVLPADQYIADVAGFCRQLVSAIEVARRGSIVTLGVVPTRPETGYGYLQTGTAVAGEVEGAPYALLERFVEKPDQETALSYLVAGNFLWNSGIFLFTAATILAEIALHLPELAAGLARIETEGEGVLEEVYAGLPSISIDHGIMEKTSRPCHVFRLEVGWSDVGSWESLYELRSGEGDSAGNLLIGEGRLLVEEASGNLVQVAQGRTVALLGVEGLAIVETDDVLLVADLRRSQEVKRFVVRRDHDLA